MRNARMEWRIAVVLVGLVALLIGYYVVHKPILPVWNGFGVDAALLLARLGGAVWDMAAVALLFLAAAVIGRWITSPLNPLSVYREGTSRNSSREPNSHQNDSSDSPSLYTERGMGGEVLIAPLIGAGILATATMLLAWVGTLNATLVVVLVVAIPLVGWRESRAWLRDIVVLMRGLGGARGFSRFCALACVVFAVTALLIALAPPVSWDAMVYHLVAPREYLSVGRMEADPINFYLGMPKNGDMLFMLAMALTSGRDTAPAVVHWAFALLALGLTAALARRAANAHAGWLAATLLLAAYNLWELMGWGYVDWAVLAYAMAVFLLLMEWREAQSNRILILIGILLGLAVGYKWTASTITASVGVYVLLAAPRRILPNALLIGSPALVCIAPWLLRGWLQYGNPIYPMAGFGLNWDARRAAAFTRAGFGMIASGDAWQLPLMPFSATIFGQSRGPNSAFTHGPFLLTLPFLLPIVWRWLDDNARKRARDLIMLIVPLYVIWVFLAATSGTGTQTRLVVPLLGVSAVLGAIAFYGVTKLPRKPLDLGFLLRIVLALTIGLSLSDAAAVVINSKSLAWLSGGVTTETYLNDNLGVWYTAMGRLDELESGAQVRMLWELKTYHCPPNLTCIPDTMLDAYSLPIWRGDTPDAVFDAWRGGGDDYVLVNWIDYYTFTDTDTFYRAENLGFPEVIARRMTPLWEVQYLQTDGRVGVAYALYGWNE
jgi:hypothetical protein